MSGKAKVEGGRRIEALEGDSKEGEGRGRRGNMILIQKKNEKKGQRGQEGQVSPREDKIKEKAPE